MTKRKQTKITYRVEISIDMDFTAADRRWFAREIAVRVKEACDDTRYDNTPPRSKVRVVECKA